MAEQKRQPSVEELVARTDPRMAELEQSLQRAHRKIDELKNHHGVLRSAMEIAVKDNMHLCKFAPVKRPRFKKAQKEEVAIAFFSDLQIGKVTSAYNVEVCEREVKHYANRIARIVEIHRKGYPVRDLHVWALGDIVEGELVFPGQAHRIEASLYRQAMVHAPRIMVDFLRTMLTVFVNVKVWCVPGNHGAIGGRQRREMHPETNADLFVYKHVSELFNYSNEKRIEFILPPSLEEVDVGDKPWCLISEIGNYSSLLFHGNQVRGYSTFPWYGFSKKVKGWKAVSFDPRLPLKPFRDAACGHFHQDTKMTMAGFKTRVNGTTERYETHVLETLAEIGVPTQHFMFVEPKRGRVTAEYEIDLSQPE